MQLIPRSPEDRQSVGPLSSIPELVRRFGATPSEVLLAAGLHRDALDDPQGSIPYAAVGVLLEAAAQKTGCAHFALEVGKEVRTKSLGLVGQLMRSAPTMGAAILDFVAHQHRNAHGSVAYLQRQGKYAYFGYAVYQPNVRGHRFICDWVAGGGVSLLRELAGAGAEKALVDVLLSRPEPVDTAPYESIFGARLHFNSEQTAMRLSADLLDQNVKGADPVLRKQLEEHIRTIWLAGGLDVVTHLRRLLRVAILTGVVSDEEIAANMAMSRRTLHRRLSNAGTRFEEVLADVRCAFAKQLLSDARLKTGDISGLIGYADPSIFTRSFRRWVGLTPSEWRSNSQLF